MERGDEVLDTTTVPRGWYEQTHQARTVFDRLHDQFRDKPWYEYVAQGAGQEKVDGFRKHQVTVYARDVEAAAEEVPDQVDRISVSVEQARDRHLDDHVPDDEECDAETSTYNCVPGGAYLYNSHGCWTSTCIGESSAGKTCLITCAHTFGACGDGIAGDPAYQGRGSGQKVGEVYTYNHDRDVALIDTSGDINGLNNTIVDESNEVIGNVSESYCDTLISNYDTVRHMGITTGQTVGYLDEKVKTTSPRCNRTDVEYMKSTADAGNGDSGGPHYWNNSDYNYAAVLGIHSSHSMMSGNHYRSFMSAAYAINNNLGFKFGSQSSTC